MSMSRPALKLVLLGNQDSNKTSLFEYFVGGFGKTSIPIGSYGTQKIISINNKNIPTIIFDTTEKQKFDHLINFYLRGAKGVIICISLFTFLDIELACTQLKRWLDKISIETDEDTVTVLACTKTKYFNEASQEYEMHLEEIKKNLSWIKKRYNLPYYICNPQTGEDISKVFEGVVEQYLPKYNIEFAKKHFPNNTALDKLSILHLLSDKKEDIPSALRLPKHLEIPPPPISILKEKILHPKWRSVKERLDKITEKFIKEESSHEQNNQTQNPSFSFTAKK